MARSFIKNYYIQVLLYILRFFHLFDFIAHIIAQYYSATIRLFVLSAINKRHFLLVLLSLPCDCGRYKIKDGHNRDAHE